MHLCEQDGWELASDLAVWVIPGDHLSLLAAHSAFIPHLIFFALVGAFLASRRPVFAEVGIAMAIGVVLNSVVKKLIQQPRPKITPNGRAHSGYGMPSDHTQTMFIIATLLALRWGEVTAAPSSKTSRSKRAYWIPALFAVAVEVAWSRVYAGFHSVEQVCVGAVMGTVVAALIAYSKLAKWVAASIVLPLANAIF